MKHFILGSGRHRLSCPARFLADWEDDLVVIWDPQLPDMPIRVTVFTAVSKDNDDNEVAFYRVLERARAAGRKPTVIGNKAIHRFRQVSEGEDEVNYFREVGLGNSICLFSFPSSGAQSAAEVTRMESDLDDMVESLIERKQEAVLCGELLECDVKRLAEIDERLFQKQRGEEVWSVLQDYLDRAYEDSNEQAAREAGVGFGQLLREEVSMLKWIEAADDWGKSLALQLGESSIWVYPEDMILKRFERREPLDLKQFASDTIGWLEESFREMKDQ